MIEIEMILLFSKPLKYFTDHHINVTSPGPNVANSAAAAAVASYSTAHSHITSMMGAGPGSPGLFQSSPSKFIDLIF
jgi:hypothetical protein